MEQIADCPFCGKENHLYINHTKKLWHCHRCKESGGPYSKSDKNYKSVIAHTGTPRTTTPTHTPSKTPLKPPHWPLKPFSLDYLTLTRGLNKHTVESLPIFSTEKGILFDFPQEDYWQERRWKSFSPPRWKNPPGRKAPCYRVERHFLPTVFLVEGILDAIAVGTYVPSAAICGSKITEQQAHSLANDYENAIILLDSTPDITDKVVYKNLSICSNIFRGKVDVVRLPIINTEA